MTHLRLLDIVFVCGLERGAERARERRYYGDVKR